MKKSVYREASVNYHIVLITCGVAMLGLSIYLTNHYFVSIYPEGLGSSAICDISSFFNCDITTFSPMSNIQGMPISVLGGIVGLLILAGYAFKSDNVEATNHFLLYCNIVICTVLCIYSLFVLRGFCPFCALYYLVSGIALFVFYKNSSMFIPSAKTIIIYTLVVAASSAATYAVVAKKDARIASDSDKIMKLYDALPDTNFNGQAVPYFLARGSQEGSEAPLKIVKFSDFQCPSCNVMSKILHKILNKYRGKVDIQYSFYPLDHNCNPSITRPFHTLACEAAYLAACMSDDFGRAEREIFENQSNLSKKWISDYAKENGVYECYTSDEIKKKVKDIIALSSSLQIKGTPTILVNGKKIDLVIPIQSFYMILDKLLHRAGVH